MKKTTNHYIRFIASSKQSAETEFDDLAAAGWTLVTCWPEGDKIQGVFQKIPFPNQLKKETLSEIPAKELQNGPDLDALINEVMAIAPIKPGFPHSLSVSTFAKNRGCKSVEMLAHLRHLGLKTKKDDPKDYILVHNEKYNVFLKQWKSAFFINVQSKEDFSKSPIKTKPSQDKAYSSQNLQ